MPEDLSCNQESDNEHSIHDTSHQQVNLKYLEITLTVQFRWCHQKFTLMPVARMIANCLNLVAVEIHHN